MGGWCWWGFIRRVVHLFPKYRSEALFEIRSGLQDATEIGAAKELDDDDIERRANTELSRLMDRDVLKAAVRSRAVQRSNWFTSQYVDEDGPRIEEAVDELEDDLVRAPIAKTALFRISSPRRVAKIRKPLWPRFPTHISTALRAWKKTEPNRSTDFYLRICGHSTSD